MYRSFMPKTKPASWLRRVLWVVCRAWLVCGLGTLVAGLGIAVYTSIWLYRSVPGRGTVIELIPQNDDDGNVNYAARFKFIALDGKVYTVASDVATNPPGFEVGEEVRLRYLSTKPTSAKLFLFGSCGLYRYFARVLEGSLRGQDTFCSDSNVDPRCSRRNRERRQHRACANSYAVRWWTFRLDGGRSGNNLRFAVSRLLPVRR
jgi:hypothetical protein